MIGQIMRKLSLVVCLVIAGSMFGNVAHGKASQNKYSSKTIHQLKKMDPISKCNKMWSSQKKKNGKAMMFVGGFVGMKRAGKKEWIANCLKGK
jgi:hypothetical protein